MLVRKAVGQVSNDRVIEVMERADVSELKRNGFCYIDDNNNNNTNICKAHIVSIRAESEVPMRQFMQQKDSKECESKKN